MSSFPRLFFPVYYWHVELRLKCWPYFKVFFNDLWWKINAKPQTSKQTKKILIIFSICGICNSVLPFWITSHLHRKSSIKAVLLLFSMHSFDWLWHISGQPHSAFLYMPICLPSLPLSLPPYFFFPSLPPLTSGFIIREPNTKTTSSHPIFTPLIRFKWHGREGQGGN